MPQIGCPGCGGVLPLTDDQLDRRVECGRCGRVFVPADEEIALDDFADPDDDIPARPTTPAGSKAVAGLVLGVIGLTLSLTGFAFCCPFAGVPFGVLGIVFGMLGRRSENRGLAVAGITTGTIAVVISLVASTVILIALAVK